MTMDADLQDDPAELPRFLAALETGSPGGEPAAPDPARDPEEKGVLDLLSGWKKVRHDPWHKVFPSRVFNAMVSWLTGVKLHDHNCGMKAYEVVVVREVR